jgi:hypothetical protein
MRSGLIEACDLVGFPYAHGAAFQEVAQSVNSIILCRAPGIYATGLIEENYASKGFHNKAKTCDWGPMAGFVLADERFSKRVRQEGGFADQQADLLQAFQSGATTIFLFISDFRRMWLIAKGLIQEVAHANAADVTYRAVGGNVPYFAHGFDFRLLRLSGVPGATERVWLVQYRDTSNQWRPVEAVVDRDCPGNVRGTYRSATTADYDLFAVWPSRQSHRQAQGALDRRPVDLFTLDSVQPFVTDANLRREIKDNVIALEDPHRGNITFRIEDAAVRLNEALRRRGYTSGNMVHHSDEGGRPFMTAVDLPAIGFFPNDPQSPYGIEDTNDLSRFIQVAHAFNYVTIINPGWLNQIVAAHRRTGYYR